MNIIDILGYDATKEYPAKFKTQKMQEEVIKPALMGQANAIIIMKIAGEVFTNLYSAIQAVSQYRMVCIEDGKGEVTAYNGVYCAKVTNYGATYDVSVGKYVTVEVNGKEIKSVIPIPDTDESEGLKSTILCGILYSTEEYKEPLKRLEKLLSDGRGLYEPSNWKEEDIKSYMENISIIKKDLVQWTDANAPSPYNLPVNSKGNYRKIDEADINRPATPEKEEVSEDLSKLDFTFKKGEDGFLVPDDRYFIKGGKAENCQKIRNNVIIPEFVQKLFFRFRKKGSIKDFRNVILKGVAGTGKTEACRMLSFLLGIPYFCFSFNANTESNDLLGQVMPQKDGSLTFVESQIVKWAKCEEGAILEAQEFNTPRQAGALVALNSALAEGHINLADGQSIDLSKNAYFVGTMNENYEGCKEINQSFISRMDLVIDIPPLTAKEMAERVKNDCKRISVPTLIKMAEIVITLAGKIEMEDSLGVSSYREYRSWVQEAEFVAETSMVSVGDIKEASWTALFSKAQQGDVVFDKATFELLLAELDK